MDYNFKPNLEYRDWYERLFDDDIDLIDDWDYIDHEAEIIEQLLCEMVFY